MKNKNGILLYRKYYLDNNNENLAQFIILAEKYNIKKALYPGSFIHITPSLVFPAVTYIDTDKRAKSFFSDPEVCDYVTKHKLYKSNPTITFLAEDYRKITLNTMREFDLLISQYAGFVTQNCTKYLKVNGLLLVNNSHGDASMASIDARYELIGVLNRKGDKYSLSDRNLDSYFIPKKETRITKEYLETIGRGIGYTKSPTSYLFMRTN